MTIKRLISEPLLSERIENQLLYYYLSKENEDSVLVIGDEEKNTVINFIKKRIPTKKIIFDNQELLLNETNLNSYMDEIVQGYLTLKLASKFHVNKKDLTATLLLIKKLGEINQKPLMYELNVLRTTDPDNLSHVVSVIKFDNSKESQYLKSFVSSIPQNFNLFRHVIAFLYLVHCHQEKSTAKLSFESKNDGVILLLTVRHMNMSLYNKVLLSVLLNMKKQIYLDTWGTAYFLDNNYQAGTCPLTITLTGTTALKLVSLPNSIEEIDISLMDPQLNLLFSFLGNCTQSQIYNDISKGAFSKWLKYMNLSELTGSYISANRHSCTLLSMNNGVKKGISEKQLVSNIREAMVSQNITSKENKEKNELNTFYDSRTDQFGFPTDGDGWI